jgi:micrococcal nuclease
MALSEPKISDITVNPVQRSCIGIAECIQGKVTKIVDGDTLDVNDVRVRLSLVNTPEIGQSGYKEATEFTANLCPVGSEVLVDEDDGQTEGSYGRIIAKVYCGERILNHQLLKVGLGYTADRFCSVSEFAKDNWATLYVC